MNKWLKILLIVILIFGLILIRKFEDVLFYDPFLDYFKNSKAKIFPIYDLQQLYASLSLRYALNTLLTVFIVAVIFQNKKYTKFTIITLIAAFVILLPLYHYALLQEFEIGENIGFYIRRFLIQPMFVLILIPAFLYQDYQKKNSELQ